jgi:hypothetical protein
MSYAVSVHADLGCLQPSFGIVSNIFLSFCGPSMNLNAIDKKNPGVCAKKR